MSAGELFEDYCHGEDCGFSAWLARGGLGVVERQADRLAEEHGCGYDHFRELVDLWHGTVHGRTLAGGGR